MAVARVTKLTASSPKSRQDAVNQGLIEVAVFRRWSSRVAAAAIVDRDRGAIDAAEGL